MTICRDCARKQGLKLKDKICGMWLEECPECGEVQYLTDRENDYIDPKAKRVTKHEAMIIMGLAD